jgi:hypothetical protein
VRHLDHRFANDGRTLVITADLVKGWRSERNSTLPELRKTFCFSEGANAEWRGGTIHIQVSAFPKPGGLTEEWAAAPPSLTRARRGERDVVREENLATGEKTLIKVEDCCETEMSAGVLLASVDLLNESGGTPRRFDLRPNRGGHEMFGRVFYESVSARSTSNWFQFQCPYGKLEIQLWLTFKPPQKPDPDEYSFWNEFLPGGRPESNRRKF